MFSTHLADDGGEKEQSFFPDDAFAMGAAAAAVATAAAPIDSSSSFGFDDSVFGSDNKDSNDTQFESSAFGNGKRRRMEYPCRIGPARTDSIRV